MRRLPVPWYLLLAPLLALAAGYATGQRPASAGSAAVSVPGSPLTLEYPPSWRAASPPAALSGIGLARAVTLAPRGSVSAGGLLAAEVSEQGNPLPAGLLAKLRSGALGEAVWLVSTPAYRYAHLFLAGTGLEATAYSIPASAGRFTLVMCFGGPAESAARRGCEGIVEGSQTAEPQTGSLSELNPQARYAALLSAALRSLQQVRFEARRVMAGAPSAATLAAASRRLAAGFAAASAALSKTGPPATAGDAGLALERALREAQSAYIALALAAEHGPSSRYLAARRRALAAEAQIHSTLQRFALFGYRID